MHHSETARAAGLDELANDIEQTKLDLANHIFIVTLMMQMNTTSLEDNEMQMKQETALKQKFIQKCSAWLRLIVSSPPHLLEAQQATIAVVFGTVLLNPYWNTFASSILFATMARIGDEELWGFTMFTLGIVQIWSAINRAKNIQRFTILITSCVWAFVAAMQGISNMQVPAPYIYVCIALFGLLSFWRVSYEAK